MRTYAIQARTLPEQLTAVTEATLSVPQIGPWLARTYAAIAQVLAAQGIEPLGPPFARYHMQGDHRFRVQAGFPVATAIQPAGEVRPAVLPGGTIAETVHIGPYDAMEPAYDAIISWVRGHGGEPSGDPWEIYFSDPQRQPDPHTWCTDIVQPYRAA